ncbi:sensor histidine kinase [Dactylosporangium sp. NPDC005572]|uniref:sensor histidine kinase n=1 Tax=Dactylosporangium sp. NPDC005572 TaxID=3156889 RepID=UPI0033A43213
MLVLYREPMDLYDLVIHETRSLEPVLGLRIIVHASADRAGAADKVGYKSGCLIETDADRVRQVLSNLAANSAAAGAAEVEVRVGRARHEGHGYVELEWADDGPGFPATLLESAFERFVRGTTARSTGGAGLGLSIVRAIVAAHDGTVAIRNGRPLSGAVVTIRLHPSARG